MLARNCCRRRSLLAIETATIELASPSHSWNAASRCSHLMACSPDRWMKNRYGGPLRDPIFTRFHLRCSIDMTGTPALQTNVTAHPAITVITAQKSAETYVVRHPHIDYTLWPWRYKGQCRRLRTRTFRCSATWSRTRISGC